MKLKEFLDYVPGSTLLHKLNPLTKLLLALMICVVSFMSKSHYFLIGMIAFNLALGAWAGIFQRSLGMLRGLAKISIVIFLLQVLFVRTGELLFTLPLGIEITTGGISFALLIVLRFIAATMPLATMLSVTQMNDLSNTLVLQLHIPYKYAFTLTTAIRFIPLFAQEMAGIMEAQTARGVAFDTKNIFKKISMILPLCVPLMITSVKKIDGTAISAELRGFHLRQRTSCYKTYGFQMLDLAALFVIVALVTACVGINHFL